MSERIDKFMTENEMVKTRSQARMLIKQGDVLCNGKMVTKPGLLVSESDQIEIKQRFLYVSRGALKLVKAVEEFDLDFTGKVIADCGASTGGFTQVSLQNGAAKVYALDVGHDQLDQILKLDSKVENIEGVNLKNSYKLPERVDFCVVDISFISITKVFPTIFSFLKPGGKVVCLIKPQFEAGTNRLSKGGIVPEKFQEEVLSETLNWFKENSYTVEKIIPSPITGKTGNVEYLSLISSAK